MKFLLSIGFAIVVLPAAILIGACIGGIMGVVCVISGTIDTLK